MAAVERRDVDLIKMLLHYKADVNVPCNSHEDKTPLILAVEKQIPEVTVLFLSDDVAEGIRIDHQDVR